MGNAHSTHTQSEDIPGMLLFDSDLLCVDGLIDADSLWGGGEEGQRTKEGKNREHMSPLLIHRKRNILKPSSVFVFTARHPRTFQKVALPFTNNPEQRKQQRLSKGDWPTFRRVGIQARAPLCSSMSHRAEANRLQMRHTASHVDLTRLTRRVQSPSHTRRKQHNIRSWDFSTDWAFSVCFGEKGVYKFNNLFIVSWFGWICWTRQPLLTSRKWIWITCYSEPRPGLLPGVCRLINVLVRSTAPGRQPLPRF